MLVHGSNRHRFAGDISRSFAISSVVTGFNSDSSSLTTRSSILGDDADVDVRIRSIFITKYCENRQRSNDWKCEQVASLDSLGGFLRYTCTSFLVFAFERRQSASNHGADGRALCAVARTYPLTSSVSHRNNEPTV